MNREMRDRLLGLAGGEATHVCVPLQGSGTFAVEATLGTLVPRDGKLLVLVNGAYGGAWWRSRGSWAAPCEAHRVAEDQPVDPGALDRRLGRGPQHHPCGGRPLRDDLGHTQPDRGRRRGRRRARPASAHRRDERLRRPAARRPTGPASPPSPPRPTNAWRACPASASPSSARDVLERARATPTPSASTCSPSGRLREERPVALHATDPCGGRLPPGARRARGRGRRGRPRGRYARNHAGPGRRHGGAGVSAACCRAPCRRRSSSPSTCPPTRISSSRTSTSG